MHTKRFRKISLRIFFRIHPMKKSFKKWTIKEEDLDPDNRRAALEEEMEVALNLVAVITFKEIVETTTFTETVRWTILLVLKRLFKNINNWYN